MHSRLTFTAFKTGYNCLIVSLPNYKDYIVLRLLLFVIESDLGNAPNFGLTSSGIN
jgi:hypothetical protein